MILLEEVLLYFRQSNECLQKHGGFSCLLTPIGSSGLYGNYHWPTAILRWNKIIHPPAFCTNFDQLKILIFYSWGKVRFMNVLFFYFQFYKILASKAWVAWHLWKDGKLCIMFSKTTVISKYVIFLVYKITAFCHLYFWNFETCSLYYSNSFSYHY
jgi:hypothetical protein